MERILSAFNRAAEENKQANVVISTDQQGQRNLMIKDGTAMPKSTNATNVNRRL